MLHVNGTEEDTNVKGGGGRGRVINKSITSPVQSVQAPNFCNQDSSTKGTGVKGKEIN